MDVLCYARKRRDDADNKIRVARWAAILLCVLMLGMASWLAENWFSYEVTTWKTKKDPYEYVIGKVNTYVCYTTLYGECYHASGCGSLWNSSFKTTVYEAEQRGYRSCSKCTPTQRTTLTLTETRYRDVKYSVTETTEPEVEVWLCGTALIILGYFVVTIPAKRDKKAAEAEMAEISQRQAQF